jgi:hypothetical protein
MTQRVYQCIRTCFAYGRKWEKGEMLKSDFVPNHHFVIVDGQPPLNVPVRTNVITTTNENVNDPMKPIQSKDVENFSEMQNSGFPLNIGMASGMGDSKPMTSMKEYKV